jgi:hypothetical protein
MQNVYQNPFEVEKIKGKRIYYSHAQPDSVKADCKDGRFIPLGSKDKKTCPASIEMQVLKFADIPNAVLFPFGEKREAHLWTQVFYVNEKGLLCSTLLKNESRDNFFRAIRECEIQSEGEKNFTDFTFTAVMSERTSKINVDYFAVTFESKPIEAEDLERNQAFAKEMHEDIFDRRVVVEYVKQNLPQIEAKDLNACFADILFGFGFIGETVYTRLVGNQNALSEPLKETENAN